MEMREAKVVQSGQSQSNHCCIKRLLYQTLWLDISPYLDSRHTVSSRAALIENPLPNGSQALLTCDDANSVIWPLHPTPHHPPSTIRVVSR
jgi:hypothetical protein